MRNWPKPLKIAAAALAVVTAVGLVLLISRPSPLRLPQGEEYLSFEIADTPAKREQGLSGRTEVPSGYGMLFIFPKKDRHSFWMKDMLVSIDILWLDDDGTVIALEEAVSPDTYPKVFQPPVPVRYVLEMGAGEARAQGYTEGAIVPLP